jgi:hypothetical protein
VGRAGADSFALGTGAGEDRAPDFFFAAGDRIKIASGAAWRVAESGADAVMMLTSHGSTLTLINTAADSRPAAPSFIEFDCFAIHGKPLRLYLQLSNLRAGRLCR